MKNTLRTRVGCEPHHPGTCMAAPPSLRSARSPFCCSAVPTLIPAALPGGLLVGGWMPDRSAQSPWFGKESVNLPELCLRGFPGGRPHPGRGEMWHGPHAMDFNSTRGGTASRRHLGAGGGGLGPRRCQRPGRGLPGCSGVEPRRSSEGRAQPSARLLETAGTPALTGGECFRSAGISSSTPSRLPTYR